MVWRCDGGLPQGGPQDRMRKCSGYSTSCVGLANILTSNGSFAEFAVVEYGKADLR
jgi:hypothetical protein